jgi:hypothetical protein
MQTKTAIDRYLELREQRDRIDLEMEDLKAIVFPELLDKGEIIGKNYGIYLCHKKQWKYTNAVRDLEKQLKHLQDHEQKTRKASYTDFPYMLTRKLGKEKRRNAA